MTRSFNDWWNAIPSDLKEKTHKGDEGNKQSLNQLNHTLLHLDLAGRHDAKPSHEELRDWLRSGQVDVVRVK
jgi:hypothetical protein